MLQSKGLLTEERLHRIRELGRGAVQPGSKRIHPERLFQ
jgi:hypothetical protein